MVLFDILLCGFVSYTFNGLIIIRRKFDELYYHERLNKRNTFYKDYMLSKIRESDQFKVFQDFLQCTPFLEIKFSSKLSIIIVGR